MTVRKPRSTDDDIVKEHRRALNRVKIISEILRLMIRTNQFRVGVQLLPVILVLHRLPSRTAGESRDSAPRCSIEGTTVQAPQINSIDHFSKIGDSILELC